ncbi:hypothetical protein ABZ635_24470 [Nocardiopsis sp. NPDC007018]
MTTQAVSEICQRVSSPMTSSAGRPKKAVYQGREAAGSVTGSTE